MKKTIVILTFLSLMLALKSSGQPWMYNTLVTPGSCPIYFGTTSGILCDIPFYANGTQFMDLQYTTGAFGIGNSYSPGYQLDVRCDPTLSPSSLFDINVGCPNCTPADAVGFRIGGNMFAWHAGDLTSVYAAIGSGFSYSGPINPFPTQFENTFLGYNAGGACGSSASSTENTFIGSQAGWFSTPFSGGTGNTAIGAHTNISSGVSNAVAIGPGALAVTTLQAEWGANEEYNTMGRSIYGPTSPYTRLELCTHTGTATFTITATDPSPVQPGATGWSGLRFDDLTTLSTPTANPGSGVLSVNSRGDVILVNPSAGTGIGYCGSPCGSGSGLSIMTGSGGYDLNGNNFYFGGNSASSTVNNVAIGSGCCYTPLAKFDVLQNSGTSNTIGIYVKNLDPNNALWSNRQPLIGIESLIPAYASACAYYNVAGWFEADAETCSGDDNYAIFVPGLTQNGGEGGIVSIGYPFSTQSPTWLLDVSNINTPSWTSPSDSILKKNVASFTYGLKAIRKLNPITYKYNGAGGFDSTHTYIGLYAQNLQRNVPNGVISSKIIKDTITRDTATILNIVNNAVIYTAVNAIKQLDSTVTSQQHTIDSFRTMLTNLQNCCNESHSSIHHSVGNSGDSNSTTNVQDISLGGVSAAPILYQNTPNPFSNGTKINYYLPEGTQGATMVFYDSYGSQLKVVTLSQTGNGTLNVTSDNLSAGIYSYSLVVNGKVIDTKRMILQK